MPHSFDRMRLAMSAGRVLLPVLALTGCAAPEEPLEVSFELRLGDSPIGCERDVDGIRLTDLRLFVYDLRLRDLDGREEPIGLADRPPWQDGSVALLDFENGQGGCRNGSSETNATVYGTVKPGEYAGLLFRVGVPETLNHDNPLQSDPPLNMSSMHWHWLTGYKFLRAGIADPDDGFWIHLGSTRCEGTATAPQGCRNANRPEVALPAFTPGASLVIIDLAPLVAAVDLEDGTPTDCSSGPDEASCEAPFQVLGLDFSTGTSTGTPPVIQMTKSR